MTAKWNRFLYITGVILLIAGALDPMEGSIVIALGSIMTFIATQFSEDRHKNIFFIASILITFGVISLWFISSLGGFDPKTEWWWLLLIIPYPIGWFLEVILLISRFWKKKTS